MKVNIVKDGPVTTVILNRPEVRNAVNYANLAVTLTYAGRPKEAMSLYDKAVRLNPRDADLSYLRCCQSLTNLMLEEFENAVVFATQPFKIERHGSRADAFWSLVLLMRAKPRKQSQNWKSYWRSTRPIPSTMRKRQIRS